MADSKLTALSEISVAALEDLLYLVDDPSGTPASVKISANRLGGLLTRSAMGYRLTTESGVPVSTSDRTSQGTIYLTPDPSSQFCRLISIYDGTRWKLYTNAEISLALTATSGKNYDVFVYDNSGTLTLELSAAWTNDTTRADALTTQDGIYVKSGATTRRWLGTIRASGANVTEDSAGGSTTQVGGKRFVWNAYNQVHKSMAVMDTTNSWSYTTDTIRQANAASGNKVEWVVGNANTLVQAKVSVSVFCVSNSARAAAVGVGIDSTSAFSGSASLVYENSANSSEATGIGSYEGYPGLGYHYAAWCESGADGTCTFLGDDGRAYVTSRLAVQLMG